MAQQLKVVHTVCSHDCPDSCGVLVHVNAEGRAVKIEGDPDNPVTRGFLCGKVAKYLDRVYSPDRLLYPMKRRAGVPKAAVPMGREHEVFERIGWDEALDLVARNLERVSREHGPESVLPYSYAGTIGLLGFGSMDRRFFHRMGASGLARTICSEAGGEAYVSVYGRKLGTDTESFHRARLIVAWGANIHGNSVHLWPQVEAARRNGARLIVIDPYRTRTAALADWHVTVQPGTDTALALGMMHVILNEGLEDRDYIARHTHGFAQLAQHVAAYTPQYVAEATGLAAEDVVRLAREYATARPAAIRLNYGIQRSDNGGAATRAVSMLPALTGQWRHAGGGVQLSTGGAFQFNRSRIDGAELQKASPLGREARVVNMSRLGHALTTLGTEPGEGPPVHALFVYNSNPAAVAPNQGEVLRGMRRYDLFTVVHEQFFTDTADYADVLLPATTFLEHTDIQGAYGHYYVQLSQQAIAPPGEAQSNVWMFSQLARHMGYTEECFSDTAEEMIGQALGGVQADEPSTNPWMQGITLDRLRREGHVKLSLYGMEGGGEFLPFAQGGPGPDGRFETPSGKIEFYSETLAARGGDALPTFRPPYESRAGAGADARYPLEMLARKADNYMNSTFANLDGHRHMERRTSDKLEMHATDAADRGIADGDTVEVFNQRGRLRLTALVSDAVQPGVVAGRLSWSKTAEDGANVNILTSERLTDIGAGATFFSTLVQVRRLRKETSA